MVGSAPVENVGTNYIFTTVSLRGKPRQTFPIISKVSDLPKELEIYFFLFYQIGINKKPFGKNCWLVSKCDHGTARVWIHLYKPLCNKINLSCSIYIPNRQIYSKLVTSQFTLKSNGCHNVIHEDNIPICWTQSQNLHTNIFSCIYNILHQTGLEGKPINLHFLETYVYCLRVLNH